jgi:hypothetical protein
MGRKWLAVRDVVYTMRDQFYDVHKELKKNDRFMPDYKKLYFTGDDKSREYITGQKPTRKKKVK